MSASTRPTISEQKDFWNWHWQHWQDRRTVNEWKQRRHEKVLSFVNAVAVDRPLILDVGCGPGWYTDKLAAFGQVTGIDLSQEAITMARTRFPHISFIAGNIYQHAFPADHFGIVVSQEVIDHVEDSAVFVDRIAHVLRPGGYLIVSCTNKFVVDRLSEQELPSQPREHIGRYFDTKTIKTLLQRRFRLLKLETIVPLGHRGILRIINSQKVNSLLAAATSRSYLERLKERAGFGYQIIVLAQKLQ
ncbi:MAG TPA: class I SAM-dependent methyltransferase [Terriglobia bacterium]|nr:class I SAM-dependent methyltransferase [Terriglobia bacterium]